MKSNAAFIAAYKRGHEVCKVVVAWLHSNGVEAVLLKQELRPDVKDRWDYVDEGDITIHKEKWQVKGRNLTFHSVESFPFPTVYLNEEYKLKTDDRGYIIVNNDLTGLIYTTNVTKPVWTTKVEWSKDDKRYCTSVLCPRELFRYRSMKHGPSH